MSIVKTTRAHRHGIGNFMYDDDDDLTGSLRGDEFLDVAFSTELYAGAKNWDIIKRSYGTRYPRIIVRMLWLL